MSVIVEPLEKGKRELRAFGLNLESLQEEIQEKYGKDYKLVSVRKTRTGKWEILIGKKAGKIKGRKKGGIRIWERDREPQVI